MTDRHACPLCMGTDDAAECAAGRCPFQARIEEHGRRENEKRAQEEAAVNDAFSPQ